MNLTDSLKQQIIQSFNRILDEKLENCSFNSDYTAYGDSYVDCGGSYSDREYEDAKVRAAEEFEEDFEEYNNSSWIDPESLNYDALKEEIIEFVRGL